MSTFPLRTVPPPIGGRSCGPCRACCTALGIHELGKPSGQVCPHECAGGCDIHGSHPRECQEYQCLWLAGVIEGDERRRPDNLGLVFNHTEAKDGKLVLVAYEAWPGAGDDPQATYLLRRLGERCLVLLRRFGADKFRAFFSNRFMPHS